VYGVFPTFLKLETLQKLKKKRRRT